MKMTVDESFSPTPDRLVPISIHPGANLEDAGFNDEQRTDLLGWFLQVGAGAAGATVCVQDVHYDVVHGYAWIRKGRAEHRMQIQLGSAVSDQISDRDMVRRGGRPGNPGAIQDDRRRRTETNGTLRYTLAVALRAHNPEVAGSNPATATNASPV